MGCGTYKVCDKMRFEVSRFVVVEEKRWSRWPSYGSVVGGGDWRKSGVVNGSNARPQPGQAGPDLARKGEFTTRPGCVGLCSLSTTKESRMFDKEPLLRDFYLLLLSYVPPREFSRIYGLLRVLLQRLSARQQSSIMTSTVNVTG